MILFQREGGDLKRQLKVAFTGRLKNTLNRKGVE